VRVTWPIDDVGPEEVIQRRAERVDAAGERPQGEEPHADHGMEMEREPTARLCRDVRLEDVRQHRPYIAVYRTVNDAPADLDTVEQLHKDNMIGKYDAALIDNANSMRQVHSGWTARASG
jgi:hypothetical protein